MAAALSAWCQAFLLTQLVEMPLYRRLLRCTWAEAFLPSLLSHPLLWFVLWPVLAGSPSMRTIQAEAIAIMIEAALARGILHRARRPSRAELALALTTSVLANMSSVAVGQMTRAWLDWP